MQKGFDIEPRALFKIVFTIGLVTLIIHTYRIFLLLFLGLFLAVALDSIVRHFQKKGLSRRIAIASLAFILSSILFGISVLLIPSVFSQVESLISRFPQFKADLLNQIPDQMAFKSTVLQILDNPKLPDTNILMEHAVTILNRLMGGVTEFFLILIFSIYLLVDGRRAFDWISDFFSTPTQLKLQATASETGAVISAYIQGQLLTSACSAIASIIILKSLNVPGALTLGTIAGILDILPIVGFLLALIPATLLGFTISTSTGVLVLILYVVYHAIESYVIAPYIYGNRLKVSGLVILLALLIAGSTGGILLAIAILPVVASYPIVERIWLVKYLGRQVVYKHAGKATGVPLSEQVKLWGMNHLNIDRPLRAGLPKEESKKLGKKLLIVEDDPDVRAMLQDILETEGYIALTANHGKDGLEMLNRNEDIGLILLDVIMPLMDGRTFLDRVKQSPHFAQIPVVFLSASTESISTEGAVCVLKKPSELETVLEVVERYYQNPKEFRNQSV